jgi:hypothetical protein
LLALFAAPAAAFVGGLAGVAFRPDCSGFLCGLEYVAWGFLAGYATWALVDSVFLAYREVRVTTDARAIEQPRLLVGFHPVQGGAVGRLYGRF